MKDNKKTDIGILRRLLTYTKGYILIFFLAFILLVFITYLELMNPYILKVAIDDYISTDNRVYYISDTPTDNSINIKDRDFVAKRDLKDFKSSKTNSEYILYKNNDSYMLKSNDETIYLTNKDIDTIKNSDIKGIYRLSFIFFLIITLSFLFNYIQEYMLNYAGQGIIYRIRNEVFNHIQNLSFNFFDHSSIGRLVTRVNNDTETLNEMFTSVLVNLFKDLFTLIGIIIIMIKMDYKLALYAFIFLPAFVIISIIFRNKIRNAYRAYRSQLSKVNSSLNENITGINTIQIFNKQEKISKEFDVINSEFLNIAKEEIRIHAMLRPTIEIVRSLAIAILVYFGGQKVMTSTMQFGTLYIFIDYLQRFFRPIFELTEKYNILQSSLASSERIFEILDNNNIIENVDNPIKLTDVDGYIEFKNVYFAYESEDWILKDLSFRINKGDNVAFVGATGAGKTSIINLLTRFYDIQKGEILIDGINIRNIDKFDLRRNIGVVLQDVFIFSGTIGDNIKLYSDITDEEMVKVSKYVNADKFISKLPKGYNQPVMERGATLSSGEKQLLSFARTLAHNPKILILDEATANIDTETELLIQDTLEKVVKDRTSIAIAHRLSTIQHADNIIVLDKGRIVESGTHQDLLDKKGTYYNLYELQKEDNKK